MEFAKVPTMLVIRKSLSKARHQYFTFVPQQTITYIQEYLDERVKQGERLSKDEEMELFENEMKKLREGRSNPHRIVREDELESYLAEGWQFIAVLPSRRILIRKG